MRKNGERLYEQVKRNTNRFPDDFVFQLTEKAVLEIISAINKLVQQPESKKRPIGFTAL